MTDPPATAPAGLGCRCAAGCELYRIKDLASLLKLHPGTIWRLSALSEAGHGDFPKPLRLGAKTVRWRASDVAAYIERLAGGVRP